MAEVFIRIQINEIAFANGSTGKLELQSGENYIQAEHIRLHFQKSKIQEDNSVVISGGFDKNNWYGQ